MVVFEPDEIPFAYSLPIGNAQNMPRQIVLLISFCLLTACNTLMEVVQPGDTTMGYEKTVNQDGETVYHRELTRNPGYPSSALNDYRPPASDAHESIPPNFPLPPLVGSNLNSNPNFHANNSTQSELSDPNQTYDFKSTPKEKATSDAMSVIADFSAGPGHTHIGFHLGFAIESFFQPRIGTSLFHSKQPYWGFDASARFFLPLMSLQPFLGLGLYLGDTKSCHTQWNQNTYQYDEICDKKFLGAAYSEAGIRYRIFSVFMRNYRINRADLDIPTDHFYGISLELSDQ